MIRTRFAPSPTGLLHVGGLRTALYNYIFAKQNNGQFILRIEDTDQNRKVRNADKKIIQSLNDFNIEFDEGPNKNEKYGPYFQSQRLDIYKKHYINLIKEKKAYVCFEKNENLIPEYNVETALEKIKIQKFVVKFIIKSDESITIHDELRGNIKFDLKLIDDPIIIKSDGFPTYHFANVIDDHYMKISHVIRGEEWISSLPKHVLLYKSFNWETPKFVHLPLLLNPDKSKLSKRQGDVHVENFIQKGYLKNAIINFIALLGWHPSGDDELFNLEYLIQNFSLARLQKSGAIFDIKKLNWMNNFYIKNLEVQSLYQQIIDLYLMNNNINKKNQYLAAIEYEKNNAITLIDLYNKTESYFKDSFGITTKSLRPYDTASLFTLWINHLKKIDNITSENINNIIKSSTNELGIAGKKLFIPLRLALIGKEHGPDLFTIINIIGLEESINRLNTIKGL
ncbi:MAG: glutamate--tRNA ligase [Candidatus Marinimicrobia bacterium]|nr:glutamate--tRNA ligase [Candidatus Neomarinimicrobiota bacterium]|tara:strand:- start:2517 stop:3875 length:1359 start_codon:yes stop_codon:yes gene_type:complete